MVNKLAKWIVRHPKLVIFIALVLVVPSAVGFFATSVNYDMLSYLPADLESAQGMDILDKDFGSANMSIIVLNGMKYDEMKQVEEGIAQFDEVKSVLWIGSLGDSPIPVSMLPESVAGFIYNADESSTLMLVQYKSNISAEDILKCIGKMKGVLTKGCMLSGLSAVTYDLFDLTEQEAPKYIAIAIVLALAALSFTMDSFVLPFVLLAALGLAVIYNMGTNIFLGEISFITQSIAAILQLGVTMDYSVFLMDRYTEEKRRYRTREAAMAKAITGTFASLAGSSLTTIFGFLALCFMSLTLGKDIGIVMAKGVLLGILTVVIVLPAMILLLEPLINKTHHRSLIPSFSGINRFTVKHRRLFSLLFVLLLVPSYLAKSNVNLYYNMMKAVPEGMSSIEALDYLKDEFNMASTHFVLLSDDLPGSEVNAITEELGRIDGVSGAMGLGSVLGTAIPLDILPSAVTENLAAGGYQLLLVNSVYDPASDESNVQTDAVYSVIKAHDPKAILTGEAAMYKDLIKVASRDFVVTNIISIGAIFVLIAIIFKSITVPLILVLSIEFAIWVNLAISFFTGAEVIFVAPTIISCVQLGATVDYAILLSTRFREEIRSGKEKRLAMRTAADSAHRSIFQSALVFFAATFGVYVVCDIDIVRSLCAMFARGALISGLVIVVFLTPVLTAANGLIARTSYSWGVSKDPTIHRSDAVEEFRRRMEENNEKRRAELEQLRADRRAKRTEKKKPGGAVPVPADMVSGTITDLDKARSIEIDVAAAQAEAEARKEPQDLTEKAMEMLRDIIEDSSEDFDIEEQRIPDEELNDAEGKKDE